MATSHGYRTKIEVLRDFLRAAQVPTPKTRIIGAANLNPTSFQRYLRLCTERELITTTARGYVTTPRAVPILAAIDGVISKSSELERAVRALEHSTQERPRANGRDGSTLRYISRQAWSEIVLSRRPTARPGANPPSAATGASSRSGGFARASPSGGSSRPVPAPGRRGAGSSSRSRRATEGPTPVRRRTPP